MISLHQLRTFLDVARTGSVREVAKESVVSQPAVSAALAGLQRSLGVALVERDGRGLRLTDAGREVEIAGRRVLALLDDLEMRARAAASPEAGRLRLGVVTTAAESVVPRLLAGFRERFPRANVELEVANRARTWDRLAYGEIDLAIGGRPPLERAFRSFATSPNSLVVVARPGSVSGTAALGRTTWLLREPGSGTRIATEEVIDALEAAPPRLTIGSNDAIRECIRIGLGVSLLTRESIARDLAAGTLAIVPTAVTPVLRPWHLVGSVDRDPSPIAARFIEHARSDGFTAG
jgi:DNA-binding transcriptional LysR family regulator